MKVEWDGTKARENLRKHGVSFAKTAAVFSAADTLEIYDDGHSDDEDRLVSIGPISSGIVVVVWTERSENIIRIISARMLRKPNESSTVTN